MKLNFKLPQSGQWKEPIAWFLAVYVILVFGGMVYLTWDALQTDRHPIEKATEIAKPAELPALELPSQNRSEEPVFTLTPDQVGKPDPFN